MVRDEQGQIGRDRGRFFTLPAALSLLIAALASPLAILGGCDPAPVEGKPCGCTLPYVCCGGNDNVCMAPGEICVGAGPWSMVKPAPSAPPLPMDDYTVFAASQVALNDRDDKQLAALQPDLVLRGWSQWGIYGLNERQYIDSKSFVYAHDVQAQNIKFLGGVSTTVLFRDQFSNDDKSFTDFATRAATGQLVQHDDFSPGLHRATLANPAYRDYMLGIASMQVANGVDGVNFDEVNETYQGAEATAGNEGFDDYNLADFNAYLLATHPGDDLRITFHLPDDNYLHADVPPGDLVHNFNYARYLRQNQIAADPFGDQELPWKRTPSERDMLATVWGGALSDRPDPDATGFVDQAVAFRYWRDIVERLRARAGDRKIFVSAKGIYPLVDFQSVGLSEYAPECPAEDRRCYVPRVDGHLDGARSLQVAFRNLRDQSEKFAPGVPVVVYLDGLWPDYDALTDQERRDYWNIYAAEAYANGLFYAFRLATQHDDMHSPATATDGHVLDTMVHLASFYRDNHELFHGVTPSLAVADAVVTSVPRSSLMVAVSDRAGEAGTAQRLVHLVNHAYDGGLIPRYEITVDIPVDGPVKSVKLVSPDLDPSMPVTLDTSPADSGWIRVTLPSLLAYDVIVVSY